jgi:hypothetical protein
MSQPMSLKHFLVAGALSGVLFGGSAAVAWAQTAPSTPPSTTTPSTPDQTPTTPAPPDGQSHNCPNMGSGSDSGSNSSTSASNVSMHTYRSGPRRY